MYAFLNSTISFLSIASPILLIVLVLAQNKSVGLGAGFGGDSTFFATRRGPEKVLHNLTIVTAIIFFASALLSVILSN